MEPGPLLPSFINGESSQYVIGDPESMSLNLAQKQFHTPETGYSIFGSSSAEPQSQKP
jgi:hypothetical protein